MGVAYVSTDDLCRINDDDDVRFVLDQHAELDFYSASSLIQFNYQPKHLFDPIATTKKGILQFSKNYKSRTNFFAVALQSTVQENIL
jgi:hypothetical protein